MFAYHSLLLMLTSFSTGEVIAFFALLLPVLSGFAILIFRSGKIVHTVEALKTDVDQLKVDVDQLKSGVREIEYKVNFMWEKLNNHWK